MNSSGIKRGLAATAISALAVTGLPALTSMASAAPGDSFTVTYTGPTLNGGDQGGVVVLRALDGTIDETQLELTSPSSPNAGSEDNADQDVEILASSVADDPSNSDYDLITLNIAVTTPAAGQTATYRIFEDEDGDLVLDAGEARQNNSQTTSGPLAKIEVAPASQSAPQGQESGDYTVTLKDSAGRTTQLDAGETVNVTPPATVTVSDTVLDSDELERGTDTFTATGNTVGSYDIAIDSPDYTGEQTKATLVVTKAASLTADEIDIVTAADDWDGFGDGTDGGVTLVRVDQNTIRIDIDGGASDANGNVLLSVDGNGVTFGGQDKASYTTTLDADGDGSITITVDAATIQEGDSFVLAANGFDQTITFDRAEAANIDGEQSTYFCQDDATCTVTAVVTDQFGNPVTTGEVEASRSGHNNDTTPQRKPVGSDGTVDFTFTDTNPVDGGTDNVLFEYFVDQFDQTAEPGMSDNSTVIEYSATGQGSDYVVRLDGENTEAADYEPGDAAIIPLTDTVADQTTDPEDEDAAITITGGEANQAITLSVDNGALILAPGEDELSEGSASVETTLENDGTLSVLNGGYRIIGTKSGPVTLTVSSAGRTETAQLVVEAQDDVSTARNVTLSGPATVPNGTTQITFVAVVTDAFGNPVPGVSNSFFNKQVTGPGMYQDGDAVSDANGQINMNVRVDNGATGDITLTIDANDNIGQFGAEEDRKWSYSVTDDGEGLSASSDTASATTTVLAAEVTPPVNPSLVVRGRDNGAKNDKIVARASNLTAGATVRLFRKTANGLKQLRVETMNSKGNHAFIGINDKNGKKRTKYVVKVEATDATNPGRGARKVR